MITIKSTIEKQISLNFDNYDRYEKCIADLVVQKARAHVGRGLYDIVDFHTNECVNILIREQIDNDYK